MTSIRVFVMTVGYDYEGHQFAGLTSDPTEVVEFLNSNQGDVAEVVQYEGTGATFRNDWKEIKTYHRRLRQRLFTMKNLA